jgi:hypothetical protein
LTGGFQVGPFQLAYQQQGGAAQNSGGWWPDYGRVRDIRHRRRRELEELEREQQAIQDATDREIARFLREQEAKDAERADLARLQALADRYAGHVPELPKEVSLAILNAQDARSRNALEQMRRVIEREMEAEEIAVLYLLLDDLD